MRISAKDTSARKDSAASWRIRNCARKAFILETPVDEDGDDRRNVETIEKPMPERAYDHNQIELKWFERWTSGDLYRAEENSARPKYYVLEMLPYPSGELHIGHVRNYSIGDALARYKWMRGFNVLHPDGLGRVRPARGKRRHRQQDAAARMDALRISPR